MKRIFDVTITRTGTLTIEAESEQEALEKANRYDIKSNDIVWDWDWEATDAVQLEQ